MRPFSQNINARRCTAFLAVCAAALFSMGCARTMIDVTEQTDYDPNDTTAQLDFWHNLPGRSAVSNDEGLHGMILLLEGDDSTGSYEARVQYFKDKEWISEDFEEPSNMAMRRGTLSKILCHAADIKGGYMMRMTKSHPRYSNRELVYMGIMPEGSELMVIDGLDYVGVVSRAQDYMTLENLKDMCKKRLEEAKQADIESERATEMNTPADDFDPIDDADVDPINAENLRDVQRR